MQSPNVKSSVLSTDLPRPIWKSSTLVAELLGPILKVSILIDGPPQVLPSDQHRSKILHHVGLPKCLQEPHIDRCCQPERGCKDLEKELVPDAQTSLDPDAVRLTKARFQQLTSSSMRSSMHNLRRQHRALAKASCPT